MATIFLSVIFLSGVLETDRSSVKISCGLRDAEQKLRRASSSGSMTVDRESQAVQDRGFRLSAHF